MARGSDLGVIYLMSNVGITAAVFYLPLLFYDRGLTDLEIGYLALPYSLALFASNALFGKLTDSRGRRPFLFLGLLSASITTFIYILPSSFTTFAVFRLLNGISLGMFPAAIIALASDTSTPMGKLSSWRALGWTLGALINGALAQYFQLEAAFIFGGILYGCAFLYALLRDVGGNVQTRRKSVTPPRYGLVIRHNWQVYLVVILRHGSGASIWIYWPLFLQEDLGLTGGQIGVTLAINTAVQAVVMRLAADRGDPQRMLLLGTLLSAMAFASFPLATNYLQISLTQILLGLSFAFFLVGGLRTVEYRGLQLDMVGTSTGLFEASFSISQIIGPILALLVFSQFQTYTSLMYVAAIITAATTLIYGLISARKSLDIEL
ncbi:MAG: MFS transporter [Candidatus Kariarchaeaceae archaeon]|jgi:MFS family permease